MLFSFEMCIKKRILKYRHVYIYIYSLLWLKHNQDNIFFYKTHFEMLIICNSYHIQL